MTTVAVLPVKRFDRAKQRLSSGLAGTSREVLAEAMLRDVLGALTRVRSLYAIVVVTGEPRAAALARAREALIVEDEAEAGQSAAASHPGRPARAGGEAPGLTVGVTATTLADLPEVRPGDDLAGILARAATAEPSLQDGDVLAVAHKVVSKAEGRVRALADVEAG